MFLLFQIFIRRKYYFGANRDGLVGKVQELRLTYLNSSFAISSPLLVDILKGWPAGLNLSALPESGVA